MADCGTRFGKLLLVCSDAVIDTTLSADGRAYGTGVAYQSCRACCGLSGAHLHSCISSSADSQISDLKTHRCID